MTLGKLGVGLSASRSDTKGSANMDGSFMNSGSVDRRAIRKRRKDTRHCNSPKGETGRSDKFLFRRARTERAIRPSRMIKMITPMMATMTTHARTPLRPEPVAVFEDTRVEVSGEGSCDVVWACDAPPALSEGESSGLGVVVTDVDVISDSETADGIWELAYTLECVSEDRGDVVWEVALDGSPGRVMEGMATDIEEIETLRPIDIVGE